MSIGEKITDEIISWTFVGISVVIVSLFLLKFKAGVNIAGYGYGSMNSTIDTFILAFSTPQYWVGIAIIGVIGIMMLQFYKGKTGGKD